uniref:PHD-type domain-containing protein n=1 Tax=Amphimedon queenslandica TaxID=400682 RepID=A0A1X7SE16_AMPQE
MSPESALAHLSNALAPPSSVIERAYRSGNVALNALAKEVLLPVDEVEMWLNHLKLVSDNRKRGAAKAAATRKSKRNARQQEEEVVVRCGVCCVIYEEETDEVERWIGCDFCSTWFHWECVNIVVEPDSFKCTLC